MAKAKRPVGATVIAVFNLILGLPCLCCAGLASGGSLMSVMDKGNNQDEFKIDEKDAAKNPFLKGFKQELEKGDFIEKEVPHMNAVNFVVYAIGVFAGLALLVSGILLLMMRNSGRLICIVGAALLLFHFTVDLAYTAVSVYPAAQKFEEKQRKEGKAPANNAGVGIASATLVGPILLLVLGGSYAVLAVAVMLSGATRDAFAAARGDRSDYGDFNRPPEDYDAYDQRREFDDRR